MGIEQIHQAKIERDDYIDDINANATSPLENSPFFENIEEVGTGLIDAENSTGASPSGSLPRIDDIQDISGNYIINEEEAEQPIQLDPLAYTIPDGGPSESDAISSSADNVEDAIEDIEFGLEHNGLNPEEWEELMDWLRDNGLGWLADYLEDHPEELPYILELLLDPDAYWARLEDEVREGWPESPVVIQHGNGDVMPDEEWEAIRDEVLEEMGLTLVGDARDRETDMMYKIYTDGNGNYYVVTYNSQDGIVVRQVEVDWDRIGNNDIDLSEAVVVYTTLDDEVSSRHAEFMRRLGLPDDWDPSDALSNIGEEGKAFLRGIQEEMWLGQDGDYMIIEEEFFDYMKKLQDYYTLLSCIFLLVAAMNELKQIVGEITMGDKVGGEDADLVETAQTKKDNAMMKLRYQYYSLKKYADSHNNRVKQEKINQARDEAYDEARNFGTYLAEVVSWGGSDIIDRKNNEIEQQKIAEIEEEYEAFTRRTEEKYEELMGDLNFDTKDPFGSRIDELMGSVRSDDLLVNVGDGYLDINQNQDLGPTLTNPDGTGLRDQLVALENLRKIWYMLHLAKEKIRQAVAEATTGVEFRNNADSLIISTLNDINQFEQQLFSTAVNYMIGIRDANNAGLHAREQQDYWHDMRTASIVAAIFGPFSHLVRQIADQYAETFRNWDDLSGGNKAGAILGTIFLGIPITDCSVNGPPVNFHQTNLKVDIAALEQAIREGHNARTETARRIFSSEEESARALDELEERQWLIVAELDGDNLVDSDENSIWTLNEARVNSLRSELVNLQNLARLIYMMARARTRLKKTIAKVASGKSAKLSEEIDTNTVDSISQNKLLAFELKLQNLKNRIQQHNKLRLDKLRRIQLLYKAAGMTVGVAIAVVLIVAGVFTGGATVAAGIVAAIGIISALGSLGSAVGNMIYHGIYGQDDNFGSSGNFYEGEEAALLNYLAADVINKLEKQAQEQIDRIRGSGESYSDVGRTGMFTDSQWALDPALFMDVNDELRRIQTLQKLVMMLEQAKQDLKNAASAGTTGSSAQGDGDFIKSSFQAINKVQNQAITLKKEMVQDIISAHNRKMAADEDFYRSIVSAAISAASSVCSVVGSAGFQGVSIAADVLSSCNTVWNTACAIVDRAADNEVMNQARQEEVNAIIDKIYRQRRRTQDTNLRRAEREAIEAMHDSNLVVGIGGGRIAVDVAAYYALRQEIEKIYNVYEAMANMVQAKSKLVKTVAQKMGMATAPEDNSALEAINSAKDSALRNLEILNINLQNYVDRSNQIQEASKALTMAMVSALIQTLQMVMKYVKINVGGQRISIRDALSDWLRGAFQDEGSGNVLGELGGRARIILSHFLGSNWDGRISVGDLVNMAIEVLMSPELARLIATAIYNAVVENEGEGGEGGRRIVSKAKAGRTASSFVDFYDAKAFEEEINLANVELQGQKEEIIRLLSNELRKNLLNLGKKAKDTLGSIRQPGEGGQLVVNTHGEGNEETQEEEQEQAPAQAQQTQAATEIRHPEQELRARVLSGDPETNRVAEQTAAAVVALQQPDSRPTTTVRVESAPEVRTTTTVRVEQPRPSAPETPPTLETAQRILQRARAANRAGQQLNGDQVVQALSALKADLQRLTIQLPGSTNPEVAQTLRRIRETLRRDLTPEEFEQVTREVAEAARALEQSDVAGQLQRAVVELQEVVRNNETMNIISERVEALVQGMERGSSSPSELVGQILSSAISDRAKAEIFEQALVQIQERDPGVAVECYRAIPPSIRERLSARTRENMERLLREGSGETSWLESVVSDDAVATSAGASFFQDDSDEDEDDGNMQDLVWGNAARRMEELSSRVDTGSVA